MNDFTQMNDKMLADYGAKIDAQIKADTKELELIKAELRRRGVGEYYGSKYMAVVSQPYEQWTVDKTLIYKTFAPKRNAPPMEDWIKTFSKKTEVSSKVSFKPAPAVAA
jgi:hypothetical protein